MKKQRKGVRSVAYPEKQVVSQWLASLQGLPIRLKKMFGCLCVYCDNQPVGWLHGELFSLREVGLEYLPDDLRRPGPGDTVQEIPIPLGRRQEPWFPRAVADTARRRSEHR